MKLKLHFHTIRYLKLKQILFRMYYAHRRALRRLLGSQYRYFIEKSVTPLNFSYTIPSKDIYRDNTFHLLNIEFPIPENGKIDWNYTGHGKLWNYHLNYFDYLTQPDISFDKGLQWIDSFIRQFEINRWGCEPYPTSLRLINWIKFFNSRESGKEVKYIASSNAFIYSQAMILKDNLEYHLMANHLLENGFALLFAAHYFNDSRLYKLAEKILSKELKEQILVDGCHIERSPMYHQEILFHLLDCVNLMRHNQMFPGALLQLLEETADKMLSWLSNMTFANGKIPLFNDCANGVAPTTGQILEYAGRLSFDTKGAADRLKLSESGYRKIVKPDYEMIVDAGDIGPDYQPGHAHCDTLSFVLHHRRRPLIVDSGTSSYEKPENRAIERGTAGHNTVAIEEFEQNELWSNFRVARRAYARILQELENLIEAKHTGYKRIGAVHKRRFEFENNRIDIKDFIKSRNTYNCYAYFHLYPGITPTIEGSTVKLNDDAFIRFKNYGHLSITDTYYSPEFNTYIPNKTIRVHFNSYHPLNSEIIIL
jgi:hypothetical protein